MSSLPSLPPLGLLPSFFPLFFSRLPLFSPHCTSTTLHTFIGSLPLVFSQAMPQQPLVLVFPSSSLTTSQERSSSSWFPLSFSIFILLHSKISQSPFLSSLRLPHLIFPLILTSLLSRFPSLFKTPKSLPSFPPFPHLSNPLSFSSHKPKQPNPSMFPSFPLFLIPSQHSPIPPFLPSLAFLILP